MSVEPVAVLAGGLTPEREVSIRSGRRVAEELATVGVDTAVREPGEGLVEWLETVQPRCVVPMVHGSSGEDGELQSLLEACAVPYTGSDPVAARLSFDKPVAKRIVEGVDILTPPAMLVTADIVSQVRRPRLAQRLLDSLGSPVMVKPARGGSALGCRVAGSAAEVAEGLVSCLAYGPTALVERFIAGVEVSVAVVQDRHGPRALPAVEIRPDGDYYDYAARYTAGATEFVVPAEIPAPVASRCAEIAIAAHRGLGLRDISRSDLIVDLEQRVWFLEANVTPGMTDTSVMPLAIEADGGTVGEMVATMVETHSVARQ